MPEEKTKWLASLLSSKELDGEARFEGASALTEQRVQNLHASQSLRPLGPVTDGNVGEERPTQRQDGDGASKHDAPCDGRDEVVENEVRRLGRRGLLGSLCRLVRHGCRSIWGRERGFGSVIGSCIGAGACRLDVRKAS